MSMYPEEVSHSATTPSLQGALNAASWNLRHWTAALPFVIRNALRNVVSESRCENLLEYVEPMYKGYKIYFSAKYNN